MISKERRTIILAKRLRRDRGLFAENAKMLLPQREVSMRWLQ
jgi:hypothetical protein